MTFVSGCRMGGPAARAFMNRFWADLLVDRIDEIALQFFEKNSAKLEELT